MLVMAACAALLCVAIWLAWRWRDHALALPGWAAPADDRARPGRALAWLTAVALLTGPLVGLLVVGPAGRLAMRLLAATSPEAQGRITEADQVVGEITVEGTLAFFVFVGLPFGLAVGVAYALVAFVLPRGILGGAVFGGAVLVVLGTAIEPLRAENPDFDIVGPGWLSVMTFAVMAVLTGVVTAPIAGRLGAALDRPRIWWAVWMVPLGVLAIAVLAAVPQALPVVALGVLVLLGALMVPASSREATWRTGGIVVRVALAVVVAVALPGFVSSVVEII